MPWARLPITQFKINLGNLIRVSSRLTTQGSAVLLEREREREREREVLINNRGNYNLGTCNMHDVMRI